MRSHKSRSTRDLSIPRSLQGGGSTESSISQLSFIDVIILIRSSNVPVLFGGGVGVSVSPFCCWSFFESGSGEEGWSLDGVMVYFCGFDPVSRPYLWGDGLVEFMEPYITGPLIRYTFSRFLT